MKATLNKSILVWIIVFLAVTNLSTIGTIIYHVYFQKAVCPKDYTEEIVIPESHLGRYFRDELHLNNQQHQYFRVFRQKFHREANIITDKMQVKRNELIVELGKEKSDTVYMHTLAKEIGNLHSELKHLTFKYYLEMKTVCNKEQNIKLFEIFKAMICKDDELNLPNQQQIKCKN